MRQRLGASPRSGFVQQYDAAGNITSDGQGLSYSYDDLGRLHVMSQGKIKGDVITIKAMGYTYDGLGQRFMKGGNAAGVIFYTYDETGRLLSERDMGNVASQDTIWLDDLPVGVVKQGQLHYIHADHLHTPRAILDPQNRPRWRWDNADPFGVGQPDENPSGLGRFVYNPRFPGQVYDAESGLHYNYFRDGYEPRTGRYTQGDPIGLAGGLNVYGYVGGNPLSYMDPLGLFDIYAFRLSTGEVRYSFDFKDPRQLQLEKYLGYLPGVPTLLKRIKQSEQFLQKHRRAGAGDTVDPIGACSCDNALKREFEYLGYVAGGPASGSPLTRQQAEAVLWAFKRDLRQLKPPNTALNVPGGDKCLSLYDWDSMLDTAASRASSAGVGLGGFGK